MLSSSIAGTLRERSDSILVLKGGELMEQRTHEALVALSGLYSELFHLQAAGYR
jgi:ABC-type multidrug transport system fused ATPase/permease subunit